MLNTLKYLFLTSSVLGGACIASNGDLGKEFSELPSGSAQRFVSTKANDETLLAIKQFLNMQTKILYIQIEENEKSIKAFEEKEYTKEEAEELYAYGMITMTDLIRIQAKQVDLTLTSKQARCFYGFRQID
ncbi:hypothetical protein [Candidatus Finniella inopinata]|uniref:Uncharacterized protein n=1 Tax=Candidatus Finniella inopinata TaxID=1696036 RepID=A0A4Q7DIL5_9PROT|nr:hypothetical protein [Candidatus Finniella inopinata]RZI46811.1 hypothetical protein EQU50_00875 [Candidatus Finniella inopinata]